MTTIYLVRHAEAEGNLYRIAQGQANSSLTDQGWKQVRALEERFRDIPVDAVYASDLYRTCATASAVYLPKGLPLHRTPRLREISVGAWEHRTWGEIQRRWPEEMLHFSKRPDLWHVEGAETAEAARDRVLSAVRDIARENQGGTAAVFTHGYVLRMLLSHLQGIPLRDLAKTPTGSNTAVSLLEAEGEKLRVVYRDDKRHLEEAERRTGERLTRQASGLEIGLWYVPAALPEQGALCADLAETEERTALLEALTAPGRETLIGYLEEDPVALLCLEAATGRILRFHVRRDCRGRGYGIQLVGQAVRRARDGGEARLLAPPPPTEEAARFYAAYGFRQTAEGDAMEKDIAFDPAFL